MSELHSIRKSYFYSEKEASSISIYIQQQKMIKAVKKLELDEEIEAKYINKLIDSGDDGIKKAFIKFKELGIENALSSIMRLTINKSK